MRPDILALDFDGVICDGLIEYFQTAWKAYCKIWTPTSHTPPEGLAERFYPLRPVIETGWEMPVLLRSLLLGSTADEILSDWHAIAHHLVEEENLDRVVLAQTLDGVRDEWIKHNLDDWLAQHRFYPGVIERLKLALTEVNHFFIISTKEGRFIKELLHQEQLEVSPEQIFGKEIKQPKHETLRQLTAKYINAYQTKPQIWFIEDRLKTLSSVKAQTDLENVALYLADWGYNTKDERSRTIQDDRIHLLSLQQFVHGFSVWTA